MFRGVKRFARSPFGKRVLVWLAPIVVSWIVSKLQNSPDGAAKKGRKRVKNKAR